MNRRNIFIFALALIWLGLIGCATVAIDPASAAPPAHANGASSTLSSEDAEAGRALYVAKCARCHKFYDPNRYTDEQWHTWMDKMSRKAKLKLEQKDLLARYLDSFRTAQR